MSSTDYPSDTAWLAYVETTQIGSPEREFVRIVNFGQVYGNYTIASALLAYPLATIRPTLTLPCFGEYFTFYTVPN
jgi:hypothetical protein